MGESARAASPKKRTRAAALATRLDVSAIQVIVHAAGREHALVLKVGDEAVLGSGSDTDLCVDRDPTVSRAHVRLRVRPGEVHLEDLISTNGTTYEAARIETAVLAAGASFRMGHALVRLLPTEVPLRTASPLSSYGSLVAGDARMRELLGVLKELASSEATVLLEGDKGTGKEAVALALHEGSKRAERTFVAVDLGRLPKEHIEGALFGQMEEDLAAPADEGAFMRAKGGTLFLEEVADLPLELQPKLLRALESRTIEPVGARTPEKVDVRFLCSTRKDLKNEVRKGLFREDLYYRLAVVKVQLPALHDRVDDIPILARSFVRALGSKLPIDDLGLERLQDHVFPANVRELRELAERAVGATTRGALDLARFISSPDDVNTNPSHSFEFSGSGDIVERAVKEAMVERLSFKDAKALVVVAFERAFFKQLVDACGGNLTRAAQKAQMDRKHLRDLLRRYGLRDDA
jgi:DNA-binding NtrC family response regulator